MTISAPGEIPAPRAHPSRDWHSVLRPPAEPPLDRARFERAMRHPSHPLASAYAPDWVFHNLMGPNCLWLAEDLAREMKLSPGQRVLDLGCGAAISSIFLAREHEVEVWAADLWIDPASNQERIREAGVATRVFPLRAEAHSLPFAAGFFDAVVSVDAYHYFGTDVRYLSYLMQFVKEGGRIGISGPANEADPDDGQRSLDPDLFEELGADWFTFRSPEWWRRHWSRTRGIAVEQSEMVPDSITLWRQWLDAGEAYGGVRAADTMEGRMLASKAGGRLGFCRLIARRTGGPTLSFGPGDFAARIA